mmetsp:Transcript_57269/g.139639  ORF Transcript_57269/g.139639 Transcript_57269/m.139639 type:complete len:492 (+) Transcript_57269:82-1557(+)
MIISRNDFVRQVNALVHALNNSCNNDRTVVDDDDDDGKDSNDGFIDDEEEEEEEDVNREHEKGRETVVVAAAEDHHHGDGTCSKEEGIDNVVFGTNVTSLSTSTTTVPVDDNRLLFPNHRLASFQLKNWQIRRTRASSVGCGHNGSDASLSVLPSEDESTYLVHPPVLLVLVDVTTTKKKKTPASSRRGGGDSAGGDSLNQTKHIDDDVDVDDNRVVDNGGADEEPDIINRFLEVGDDDVATLLEEDESNQIQYHHRRTSGTTDTAASSSRSTLWHFSIVYSDTYRVPVLYFHVERYEQMMTHNESSSIILGRREVLDMLLKIQRERQQQQQQELSQQDDQPNDQPDDTTWEFISQEEHPITGFPSFFLHPCQSSDRMNLVLSSLLMTTSSSSSITCSNNSKNDNDDDNDNLSDSSSPSSPSYLWTWMSMIFPAVGHPIPSTYFIKIQNRLLLLQATDNRRVRRACASDEYLKKKEKEKNGKKVCITQQFD